MQQLALYERYDEAHIVKTRLEHEGINCLLLDEHVNRLYGSMVLVRLCVDDCDLERAKQILRRYQLFQVVEDETA